MGGFHSPYRSKTGTLRAIFIAPTKGRFPFNVPLGNRDVAGDFHRPYGGSDNFTVYHSTCRPETGTLRAIFIAPTKALIFFTVFHSTNHCFYRN